MGELTEGELVREKIYEQLRRIEIGQTDTHRKTLTRDSLKDRDFKELYEVQLALYEAQSYLAGLNPRMGNKYWSYLQTVRNLESLSNEIFERIR